MIDLGGYTATGPREANEDNYYAQGFPEDCMLSGGLAAFAMVSDGMGGYQGGDVASGLAVRCARSYIDQILPMAQGHHVSLDPAAALEEIAHNANDAILEEQRLRGNVSMGATFVGAFIGTTYAWVGHIGDSRAYLIRNGIATQITEDHSRVGRMLSEGVISEAEAQRHPDRNRIERALGFPDATMELDVVELYQGDALLLCSDGVYTTMGVDQLARCLTESADAMDAAQGAVTEALNNGTDDNSTAVVVALPGALGDHGLGRSRHSQRELQHEGPQATEAPLDYAAKTRSSSRRSTVILSLIFVATISCFITLFVLMSTNGGSTGSTETIGTESGAGAATEGPASSHATTSAETTAAYTVTRDSPLMYLDANGMVRPFSELGVEEELAMPAGATLKVSTIAATYGSFTSYRKLDGSYLDDLLGDVAAYLSGGNVWSSQLSSQMYDPQYPNFIASLAALDEGTLSGIAGLALASDDLSVVPEDSATTSSEETYEQDAGDQQDIPLDTDVQYTDSQDTDYQQEPNDQQESSSLFSPDTSGIAQESTYKP